MASKENCKFEALHIGQCSSPEVYSCELHFRNHLVQTNSTHTIDSSALIALSIYQRCSSSISCWRKIKESAIKEKYISNIENIFQAHITSKKEQDPVISLLMLQPDNAF
ncbi:unnamed protein product [Blepharisma stoltei]|uniref:Uncharacterized protein n=1 Tax=Blepharisma stoltei TaxID=1481888 RepID=A0AAU9IDN0_9CILI|nr:unnamed protein product [Blepharisma stoltei]